MSMEITTVIEFFQVLFVYLSCFFVIPHIVLNRHLQGKLLYERFLLCLIISNFYVINIVFIIYLFHLPKNRIIFSLMTIVPAVIAWQRINRPNIRHFFALISVSFSRLMLGEAKIRTIWGALSARPRLTIRHLIRAIISHFRIHTLEWAIYIILMGYNVWYHSYGTLHKYVYGAPDIIVHHYWIHQMDSGIIFTNGIYPFGFHNVMFFMHRVFGLKIVSILRTFGAIEAVFIFSMIYILLRKICHSKIVPLLGIFFFTIPNLYNYQGTMRYQWALPQEYAMLFLYPCAFFLIQYFERKRQELNTEKEMANKNLLYAWLPKYHLMPSTRSLIFFGISFSLTLAIHFYITIIAFLLCLAIACAYLPTVLHYRYFCSIATAGILSVLVAVSPLVLGYLEGHDLEGSLHWAMESMSPGNEAEEENPAEQVKNEEIKKNAKRKKKTGSEETVQKGKNTGTASTAVQTTKKKNLPQKIGEKLIGIGTATTKIPQKILNLVNGYNFVALVYLDETIFNDLDFIQVIMWLTEGVILLGILTGLISRKYYCRNMIAVGIYFFFMTLLVCGDFYHLPKLMDEARSRLFICYATPVILACGIDFLYTFMFRPIRYHATSELAPVILMGLLTASFIVNDYVKPLNIIYTLQASGEMYCDYRIIKEYPKKNWTIVTTTNSLQIISDDGWLMETSEFIKNMQDLNKNTKITIPSKYVFFYIEKKPLLFDTYGSVEEDLNTIGYVSEEEAAKEPVYEGSLVYYPENRYILESKFFYWAKAFEEKYPREFQVYYEDDNFICYRILQNEYHLYNFAIDYGYNVKKKTDTSTNS